MRAARGRFDAIIIDGDLPDKDGLTLLSEIRTQYSDMPAVLTAKPDDQRRTTDPRTVNVQKPYTAAMIIDGLTRIASEADRAG
ncbi:response regulator [Sphingomonas sp. NFR15]|uniref:response regulator n=1 Tax=Sphingomonas sp. NFR15 TaxID=1566282 RepID=UPI000B82EEFD|nr:response regulator [Sphingomonas sp. NFR15]